MVAGSCESKPKCHDAIHQDDQQTGKHSQHYQYISCHHS